MKVKFIKDDDFVNYYKCSLFIGAPTCDWKCCKEAGVDVCQNLDVVRQPTIEIDDDKLIQRYLSNPITKAIVFGGLEPMLQFEEVYNFIDKLRWEYSCFDPVVIYTGYNADEITDEWSMLSKFDKIIIKFGRFIPNQAKHYDETLGVWLISDNQYAKEL